MNHKRFFSLVILVMLVAANATAKLTFSDSARYSIITCAPGDEVYSAFGHTAIRVIDPQSGMDLVFNYGIFSFETDHFIWKFVKGETDYQLGVYPYKNFIQEYLSDDRDVWEQVLNLRLDQRQRLQALLLRDYLPENRVYRYSFFFDNCATRVRDRIFSAVEDSIVAVENDGGQQTFRELLTPYIYRHVWLRFGINLAVAKPADGLSSFEEEMFLPDYLMRNFEFLLCVSGNENVRPLVGERIVIHHGNSQNSSNALPPSFLFAIILLVSITLFYFFAEKYPNLLILAYLYYVVVGVAGMILYFLAFVSVHPAMNPNYHIMWALPFHLIALPLLAVKRLRATVKYYWFFCVPYYFIVPLLLLLSGQHIDNEVFLINGILFVSAIFISRDIIRPRRKSIEE